MDPAPDEDNEPEEVSELIAMWKANRRPYAGYFTWRTDRSGIEEVGVVRDLDESLTHSGQDFFHSIQARGRGNDPPDCEATLYVGGRVGIEVTELVDGDLIKRARSGEAIRWVPFTEKEVYDRVAQRIARKDGKDKAVKGGPYDEYLLVIYCDDPRALFDPLIEYLRGARFAHTTRIDRAFLLLSYCPEEGVRPFIELNLAG